jgi:type I restriction enzyme, S subunit
VIADLKPYPNYKDSGVPWLGEVPEHWEVRRLKQIAHLAYGDSLATESRQQGAVPVFGSNGRAAFHSVSNTKAPCIVIGRKGSLGKVNFSADPVFAIDTTFLVDSRYTKR